MAGMIIKQPDGKYCIFSGVVDNVTYYDMTPEEIVDVWVEESRQSIEAKVSSIIEKLENDEKPYFQHTMNFDEMIDFIEVCHGKKEAKKIKNEIMK